MIELNSSNSKRTKTTWVVNNSMITTKYYIMSLSWLPKTNNLIDCDALRKKAIPRLYDEDPLLLADTLSLWKFSGQFWFGMLIFYNSYPLFLFSFILNNILFITLSKSMYIYNIITAFFFENFLKELFFKYKLRIHIFHAYFLISTSYLYMKTQKLCLLASEWKWTHSFWTFNGAHFDNASFINQLPCIIFV